MKKIINIVMFAALLLGVASCSELLDPSLRQAGQQIPENAKVTVFFGISSDIATKAEMADEPGVDGIETIHVLVFNKSGVLVETAEAQKGAVTTNGPSGASYWSAILTMAGEERRLHFIANLPEDQIPSAGSETSIFQSLATPFPQAAYWQRKVLDLGIQAYQYKGNKTYDYVNDAGVLKKNQPVPKKADTDFTGSEGNWSYTDINGRTVNKDDYITRQGEKIVNGTGFYAIEEVVESVPMVRNFARFRIQSSWTKNGQTFTLTQGALINKPAAGFIAPYDNTTNSFVSEYMTISGDDRPRIANLANYSISLPVAGIDKSEPKASEGENKGDFIAANNDGILTLFSYERAMPTSDPTCMLVAGKWGNTGNEIWYKIELTNQDGEYFPIYRDFTYEVNITSIEGNDGYRSSALAFKSAAVGDISNSAETQTLEQISDDKGLTLWVNYIDYTAIDADIDAANPYVTLLYTCFRQKVINGQTQTLYFNDLVDFTRQKHPDYSTLPYATEDEDAILLKREVQASDNVIVPDANLTWYIAKVKLNKITGDQNWLRSQIHVEADVPANRNKFSDETRGYAKKLSRDVTYTVMPKQNLTLKTTGIADTPAGNQTTLTITLPTILTKSLFPLTLMIEAQNNNLNPVGNLAVDTGPSAFDQTKNSFYFLKTISYSEYFDEATGDVTSSFDCEFKTTKASGNVPTKIRVSDKKGYFNVAEVDLKTTDSTGGAVTNP
jgi:hypothetical protein